MHIPATRVKKLKIVDLLHLLPYIESISSILQSFYLFYFFFVGFVWELQRGPVETVSVYCCPCRPAHFVCAKSWTFHSDLVLFFFVYFIMVFVFFLLCFFWHSNYVNVFHFHLRLALVLRFVVGFVVVLWLDHLPALRFQWGRVFWMVVGGGGLV